MIRTDIFRYARVHRAVAILAGTSAVALLSAFFGGVEISLPSIGSGGVTTGVPFRRELPVLSAVFLAAALGGAMATHEEMATSAMHRYRRKYCMVLTLTVCVFSFGVEALAVGAEPWGHLRSIPFDLVGSGAAFRAAARKSAQLGSSLGIGFPPDLVPT